MSRFLLRYFINVVFKFQINSEFQNSLIIWQRKHFPISVKCKVGFFCSDKQFRSHNQEFLRAAKVQSECNAKKYESMFLTELKVTSFTKRWLLKMFHLRHRFRVSFNFFFYFRSQDIQVFVFSTIPWFTISVSSQWLLVHEIGCICEYNFWTTTH